MIIVVLKNEELKKVMTETAFCSITSIFCVNLRSNDFTYTKEQNGIESYKLIFYFFCSTNQRRAMKAKLYKIYFDLF